MKQRQKHKVLNERGRYMKLDDKCSDSSGDETELFVRKVPYREVPVMEKTIEEEDTLQALSIKYHCSIAELKRLNNIEKDNEIFARRTIKVPIRPFSVALAAVHSSGNNSPTESQSKPSVDPERLKSKLSVTFSTLPSQNEAAVNEIIFNSNLLNKPSELVQNPLSDINDEETNLLAKEEVIPETVVTRLSCSGADADISWIALVICIVIVIFAVPLIYVLYIAEHPEQYHHHSNYTS